MSGEKRIRLLISGRVQGVCFRAYARDEARRLGLKGWVRNLPDGRVEALAQGDPAKLGTFEAWCHRDPRMRGSGKSRWSKKQRTR